MTDTLRPLIGKRADGGWGRGISTWVIVTTRDRRMRNDSTSIGWTILG